MESLSAREYATTLHFENRYLIDTLVPAESRVVIIGPPKQGKSYLALQMAMAVAAGTPFMGAHTTQGRVLYLQFDTPPPLWHERINDVLQCGIEIHPNLHFNRPAREHRRMNLMTEARQSEVRRLLDTFDPSMVILDVLRKVHNRRENESDDMKLVFDVLNDLFAGRALVIVHHTHKLNQDPKAPRPDPSNASRGSSAVTGEVDAIWLLWRNLLTIELKVLGHAVQHAVLVGLELLRKTSSQQQLVLQSQLQK